MAAVEFKMPPGDLPGGIKNVIFTPTFSTTTQADPSFRGLCERVGIPA